MDDNFPDIDLDFEHSEYIQKIKNLEYETDLSNFTEDIMRENMDAIMDFVDEESETDDDDVDHEMRDKIKYLAFANAYYLCDKDLLKQYYYRYFDMAHIPVSLLGIPDEILPVADKEQTIREEVESLFFDAFNSKTMNRKALKRLNEIFPDNPYFAYVHIVLMHQYKEKKQKISKTLQAYLEKYPDSWHLQLYELFFNSIHGIDLSNVNDEHLIMSTWFGGRKQMLHYCEYFIYAMFVLLNMMHSGENEKLLALTRYVMQKDNEDEVASFLIYILPNLLTDNNVKDFNFDDEND